MGEEGNKEESIVSKSLNKSRINDPRIIRILKISFPSPFESKTHRDKSPCRPYEIGRNAAALLFTRHHSLSLHPSSNN